MVTRKIMLMLFLISLGTGCLAQQTDSDSLSGKEARKLARKNRPDYIGIGAGLNWSSHRDFATSPLIYSGTMAVFHIDKSRFDEQKESSLSLRLSAGNQDIAVAETFTATSVVSFFNSYQQLFQVKRFSNEQWNVKAGGNISWGFNYRDNPSFGNNATGVEWYGTLFGSVKVTRDVSRKKAKEVKILFIKYKLKPLRRNISWQFNAGLLNSNLRNGFAFINQTALVNEPDRFTDYQFNIFSGFRLSSQIDYTLYLNTGNMVRFSYLWDAYRTGEEFDKFEMGHHMFTTSLWFKIK